MEAGPEQEAGGGDPVSLAPATFNDKGTLDEHMATLDWGDGSVDNNPTVTESPFGPPGDSNGADGTVMGDHTYLQDGLYTVEVCVKDNYDYGADPELGWVCDTLTIMVKNLPPVVDAGPDQTIDEGQTVDLAPATFTDSSILDTHPLATIDWGDGTVEEGLVIEPSLGVDGSVTGSHAYDGNLVTGSSFGTDGSVNSSADPDSILYTVTVCVTGNDGGKTCDTLTITLSGNSGSSGFKPVYLPLIMKYQ